MNMVLETNGGVGVLKNNSVHLVEGIMCSTSKHHCKNDEQRFSEACSFDLRSNGQGRDWIDSNFVSGQCWSHFFFYKRKLFCEKMPGAPLSRGLFVFMASCIRNHQTGDKN